MFFILITFLLILGFRSKSVFSVCSNSLQQHDKQLVIQEIKMLCEKKVKIDQQLITHLEC